MHTRLSIDCVAKFGWWVEIWIEADLQNRPLSESKGLFIDSYHEGI